MVVAQTPPDDGALRAASRRGAPEVKLKRDVPGRLVPEFRHRITRTYLYMQTCSHHVLSACFALCRFLRRPHYTRPGLPEDWRRGELSPADTSGTLLLPHPLGRRTGENCLSKLRRVVVTV